MMAAMQRPAGDGRAQDEILAVRLQPSAPQEASTDDRPATDEMLRLQPSLPLLAAAESEPGPSVLGQSSHGREPTAGELWSSLSAAVAAQAEPFELRARAAGREAFGEAFASSPLSEVGRSELGEGTPDRDDRARRTAWSPLSPAEAEMAPPATREGTPSQEARGQELWTSLTAVSNTALSLPLRWLPAAPASPSPEQKPPSPPSPPLPFPLPAQPPPSQQPPQLPSATMLPPVMFKDVFGVGPAMPRDDAVADAGSAAQAPIPAGSPEELLPRQEPLLPPPAWEELQHYALELPSLFAASVSSVASLPEAGRWALPTAVGEMTAPLSLSSTLSAAWLRFNPWQVGPADRFEDWVPRDGWEHWLRHAHAWRDAPDEPQPLAPHSSLLSVASIPSLARPMRALDLATPLPAADGVLFADWWRRDFVPPDLPDGLSMASLPLDLPEADAWLGRRRADGASMGSLPLSNVTNDRYDEWLPRDGWTDWFRHAHEWRDPAMQGLDGMPSLLTTVPSLPSLTGFAADAPQTALMGGDRMPQVVEAAALFSTAALASMAFVEALPDLGAPRPG